MCAEDKTEAGVSRQVSHVPGQHCTKWMWGKAYYQWEAKATVTATSK